MNDIILSLAKRLNVRERDIPIFGAVITEHCLDKGIYDEDDIKLVWEQFVEALETVAKRIKGL